MQGVLIQVRSSKGHSAMQEWDDEKLLNAVAQSRDQGAFNELAMRFQHPAFALALRITGQHSLAEEAVQEALLRLWTAASTYRSTGSVRAWFFRIVARECLMVLRSARSAKSGKERLRMLAEQDAEAAADKKAERQEEASALSTFLERMPFSDRQILALHFGGGLTHAEIAQELDLPRRTVTSRLQRNLEELRGMLAQAGFGATAALAGEAQLSQALTAGAQAPAHLRERVLERLLERGEEAASSLSRRAVAQGWRTQAALLPAGLLLAATVAGVVWWSSQNQPASQPLPLQAPAPSTREPVAADSVASAPPLQVWKWDFNTPEQALDFSVKMGNWHYSKTLGLENSGCMETETLENILAWSPDVPFHLPLRVEARLDFLSTKAGERELFYFGVAHAEYSRAASLLNVFTATGRTSWMRVQNFVTADYIDHWIVNQRHSLKFYEKVPHVNQLRFYIKGRVRIDNLIITEIPAQDLPDVKEYLSALEKIPSERRKGSVMVPEIKSVEPGKTACFEFQLFEKSSVTKTGAK